VTNGIGIRRVAAAEGVAGGLADVLDTADAERLSERVGWRRVGLVPRYAPWPEGGFVHTTLYDKELTGRTMSLGPAAGPYLHAD